MNFQILLCVILLLLQIKESTQKTQELKSMNILKNPSKFLKSIDNYVESKTKILAELEAFTDTWRQKTIESNQNPKLYVHNPLNCLKVLSSLVIDLQLFGSQLLDQANSGFEHEDLLLATENQLKDAGRELAVMVAERGISWNQFLLEQTKMDDGDKAQLLKVIEELDDLPSMPSLSSS